MPFTCCPCWVYSKGEAELSTLLTGQNQPRGGKGNTAGSSRCVADGAATRNRGGGGKSGESGSPVEMKKAVGDDTTTTKKPPSRGGSLRKHNFLFGELLGEGAYSRVFHAKLKGSPPSRYFAVKIMDKRFIKKEDKVAFILAERKILMRLAHPHIVKLHSTFTGPRRLYIVMELCRAELLHAINYAAAEMHGDAALSVAESCFYAAEVVEALEYLRSMCIVHRDLKPENILLDKQGHVKLADFGTALDLTPLSSSAAGGDAGTNAATDDTAFVGTAQYISPEVLDDMPATYGSDLWALGCVMFQCLVGRPIFQGENDFHTFELIHAFPNGEGFEWPAIFDNAPHQKDLILKLLKQQPSERLGVDSFDDLRRHRCFEAAVKARRIVWGKMTSVAPPSKGPPRLLGRLDEPHFDGARDDWDLQEIFEFE